MNLIALELPNRLADPVDGHTEKVSLSFAARGCRACVIRWRTASTLAAVMCSLSMTAGAASTTQGSGVINGFVAASADQTLDVKIYNFTVIKTDLGADQSLIDGRAVDRQDLRPGDMVGVSAFVVRLPVGDRLIARSFATVRPSLPASDGAHLLNHFLGPVQARAADSHAVRARLLIGTFAELRPGGLLVMRLRGHAEAVKLGPEAYGYRLSHAQPRSIAVGDKVSVLVRDGRAAEVFLLVDDAPASRDGAAP